MKKYSLFLFFALMLAACAPSTPMPTETPIPTVTSTLTPVPTIIPTATVTSTPDPWVAIATKYDIPEEQVAKLSDIENLEFEVLAIVDGILVKDSAGTNLFYFSRKADFLVSVSRWKIVTNAKEFRNVEFTDEEIISDEFFAFAEYVTSLQEGGLPPDDFFITTEGQMREFNDSKKDISYLFNFPDLVNKGILYGHVVIETDGQQRDFTVIVNSYGNEEYKFPVIFLSEYSQNNPNRDADLETMKRLPFIMGSTFYGIPNTFVQNSFDGLKEVGGFENAVGEFQNGNPSLISQPGVVYLTYVAKSPLFGNAPK